MAGTIGTTILRVVALCLSGVLDLSLFYASDFAVTRSVFGHFTRLWFSAALRFLAPTAVSLLVLGDARPILIRCIAVHSLLPAVLETGTNVWYHEQTQCSQLSDLRCWLLSAGASLAAALFWEITVPDTDEEAAGKVRKQKTRVLFMRVLRLFKPDYPLLLLALVFLSLAVICKYDEDDSENMEVIRVQTDDSRSHMNTLENRIFEALYVRM